MSFSFCPVDVNVYCDEKLGCSGNGAKKGDISCKYGDGRIKRVHDYGDKRGDISFYDDTHRSRSKETSHSTYQNMRETVDGDCRGGYRPHTIHSSSYNPGYHGILWRVSFDSRHVDDSLHENLRSGTSDDGVRRVSSSQYISHSSSHNDI